MSRPSEIATSDFSSPAGLVERVAALRKALPEAQVVSLVRVFLEKTPPVIGSIAVAQQSRDLETLLRCAHLLVGSCSHLGSESLIQLCRELEEMTSETPVPKAAGTVVLLREEFARVRAFLVGEFGLDP